MGRHLTTLLQIKATYQPCSAEWRSADRELRRKRCKKKVRKNRPYKRRGGWFALYRRKYGLYVDGIAYLLKITHKEVHDLERKGILKHRIILEKMKGVMNDSK